MNKFHFDNPPRDCGSAGARSDSMVLSKLREFRPVRANEAALEIGLLNNMPEGAKEATERQFRALLERSAGAMPFRLHLFSPPAVRSAGQTSVDPKPGYAVLADLWDSKLDALIVTGTEPRALELRDEPYWSFLAEVFDWAEFNSVPTILSCLAAHAAVLHVDGIVRRPLPEKRFGVFEHCVVSEHPLTRGLPSSLRVPHSRWNELDEKALVDCGYQVLTSSSKAGVDLFVKHRRSLFVHFQGHPEYRLETLLGEYKRDVRRFLAGKRENYPSLPEGYFSKSTEAQLIAFRERAFRERGEELWPQFPNALAPAARNAPWDSVAILVFRNLLTYAKEWR